MEHARWGPWDLDADVLPRMYVDAVQKAGGAAVLLPVDEGWASDPAAIISRLDGLLLAGGIDVAPATYGAEPHPKSDAGSAVRDAGEIALYQCALERDLPVLGICRGLQVMNVAAGGTLVQHLPEVYGGEHLVEPGSFEHADHDVEIAAGSLLAQIVGDSSLTVKCHHHQAAGEIGRELNVTAHAKSDSLPEAVELPGHKFVLGVQWHPEADPTDKVVPAFLSSL